MTNTPTPITLDTLSLSLYPSFLDEDTADALYHSLLQTLDWQQETILIFGKQVASPRLQCFYGDQNVRYRYSGREFQAQPWTDDLKRLKDQINHTTQQAFNGVLCNLYRDGKDSMGWHSDNERELGESPVIASYSLGERRELAFRRTKETKQCLKVALAHNELLLMPAGTQEHYQHAIPKTAQHKTARINLTFRTFKIIPRKDHDNI